MLSAKTLLSTAVGWHVSVFTIATSHTSLLKTSPQQSAGFIQAFIQEVKSGWGILMLGFSM
jgi:hypothetical protein